MNRIMALIALLIILTPLIIQAQSEDFVVFEEDLDRIPNRCISYGDDVFILSEVIDYLDGSSRNKQLRIQVPGAIGNNGKIVHVSEINDDSIWIVWSGFNGDSMFFKSTSYHFLTESFVDLDSTFILIDPIEGEAVFTTNIVSDDSSHFFAFSLELFIRSEIIGLVQMNSFGKFLNLELKRRDEVINRQESVFRMKVVKKLFLMDGGDFLISDCLSWRITLIDNKMNVLQKGNLRFFKPNDPLPWLLHFPDIERVNDSLFVVSDDLPYSIDFYENQVVGFMHYYSDTMYIDPLSVYEISNPENLEKVSIHVSNIIDDISYTSSNPYYGVNFYKASFPGSFFLTKLDSGKEEWHKEFGDGEKFWRAEAVHQLDRCKTIVIGTVHDYNGNDFIQEFYMIFDCDGEIITSSVNIAEIDMLVYPNPADDVVRVNVKDENVEYDIILYSLDGKLVQKGSFIGGDLDVSGFPVGSYFLSVKGNGNIFIHKIIIAR